MTSFAELDSRLEPRWVTPVGVVATLIAQDVADIDDGRARLRPAVNTNRERHPAAAPLGANAARSPISLYNRPFDNSCTVHEDGRTRRHVEAAIPRASRKHEAALLQLNLLAMRSDAVGSLLGLAYVDCEPERPTAFHSALKQHVVFSFAQEQSPTDQLSGLELIAPHGDDVEPGVRKQDFSVAGREDVVGRAGGCDRA